MKTYAKFLAVLALALLAPMFAQAQIEERITSFRSDILVAADGGLTVTEIIEVVSQNQQINHGIYRDFPIYYREDSGLRTKVGFEVVAAMQDGQPVDYSTSYAGNGVRVYLGDPERIITPGPHQFKLSYRTDRQVGFFDGHDELYWNVTGNGWVFAIDSASATISLPAGVPQNQLSATLYTGVMGSLAQDGSAVTADSQGLYQTTAPLAAYEGLTVLLTWPKGVVTPPGKSQALAGAVRANLDYILALFGLILLVTYYVMAWFRYGRDSRKGVIIPLYESPDGMSPAMLNHIRHMGSDGKAMTASLISMGVKGAIKVTEEKGLLWTKTYKVTKLTGTSKGPLAKEEQELFDGLFKSGEEIELKSSNATTISKAQKNFSKSLKSQAGKTYFRKNTGLVVLGAILAVAVMAVPRIIMANAPIFDTEQDGAFWLGLGLALLVIVIMFSRLLRMYTPEGRKALDGIEGFRQFLSVTEKDRLAFHNPPDQTPALFEKMLPFALALGVEHKWAQQFASAFSRLEQSGQAYSPGWYAGYNYASFNAASFASHVGDSFGGAVSSSASPPGSSSGSGGGGSGGGGGGGGGGGW